MRNGRSQNSRLLWTSLIPLLLLSCGVHRPASRTVLHDGYPRGPGSFCALNPEGCPPQPQNEPVAVPRNPVAFDVNACLDACEAGGAVLDEYCRNLAEAWQRRLCWSVSLGSKVVCKNMCYGIHTCAASEGCPERKE